MAVEPGRWLKLNPATITALPDAPGVFEIANLVRTVLVLGRGNGSLRHRLAELGTSPANLPASIGGYYVRYELTSDEEAVAAEREAAYRAKHAGNLPGSRPTPRQPAIRLLARHAA